VKATLPTASTFALGLLLAAACTQSHFGDDDDGSVFDREASDDDDGAGDDGGNGAGGSGGAGMVTVTTGSATAAPSSTTGPGGQGSTSSGPMLECDDGTPHESGSEECQACFDCAVSDNCSDAYSAFVEHPDAFAWDQCIFGENGDGGCLVAPDFDACAAMCEASYPGVEALYLGMLSCAICVECPNNCNAASQCI
jgi:hypothetical protein